MPLQTFFIHHAGRVYSLLEYFLLVLLSLNTHWNYHRLTFSPSTSHRLTFSPATSTTCQHLIYNSSYAHIHANPSGSSPDMPSLSKFWRCSALVALASFSSLINAHSWVEQLTVISPNGTFIGAPGYVRGNVLRTAPNFGDPLMVNLLPPNGRPASESILKSDLMCKDSQQKQVQTDGSPRLQAAPGALVALRYQENGHVTLPQTQPGKPENRGTVFIYGTTQPSETDTFLGIHKQWNAAGTGGDKRGKLLATQPFDDGQCYQINGGEISVARQTQFPHQASQLMGADLWCQNDIAVPSDAPVGKLYTLYWVWEWPTAPSQDVPNGKAETYTSCLDLEISNLGQPNPKVSPRAAQENGDKTGAGSSLNNMAIPKYMKELTQQSDAPASQPATIPQPQQSDAPPAQPATIPQPSQGSPATQSTVTPSMVTVTKTAIANPVTVTVTASASSTPATISTDIVTVTPSASVTHTTTVGAPVPTTNQASVKPATPTEFNQSVSGTSLALPVVTPGASSSASPSSNKRSRIFGSGAHRYRRL